jgi:16S rRNA (adenine1518-N6/adenine1519-N6)-dimethyltransferase
MQYTLKKSLGQHFLKDENISKKIVSALRQRLAETGVQQLLEVGPGAGALTKYLLQIANIDFKAVELDADKVAYLEKNFPSIKDKIIHKDFLDIDAPFENSFIVV